MVKQANNQLFYLPFAICYLLISGCATTTNVTIKPKMPGFYYRIGRHDTLYRIAKTYSIDLDTLANINNIYDTAKIKVGERLFIPQRNVLERQKIKTTKSDLTKDTFIWPIKGNIISYFNQKSNNVLNKGVDIQANLSKDVIASGDGVISFCGELLKGEGKTVIIQHNDRISTVYSHILEVFVKINDKVSRGQIIAKIGNVGRNNIAYLHFEVRDGLDSKNPLYYLP